MASIEAQCVLAIGPNYWGKGATIKEAERELKRAGYSPPRKPQKGTTKRVYYFFNCPPDEVAVTSFLDCQFNWPKDKVAMRLEEKW